MDRNKFKIALEKVLSEKGNKNFSQTVDLVINLKDLDLKKPDHQIDIFVDLPHSRGKVNKICGFIGPELLSEAKENLDFSIEVHDFDIYKSDPKKIKALVNSYDLFISQATIMPQVATVFGRVLGPRGKMPNPKAGCIVPPKSQLGSVRARLEKVIRVSAKSSLCVQAPVGIESQPVNDILDNIEAVYTALISSTIQGENNVKAILLKLTMGKPERVE